MAWRSAGQVFLGDEMMTNREYSDETARVIDEEVAEILRTQENRCREVLSKHRTDSIWWLAPCWSMRPSPAKRSDGWWNWAQRVPLEIPET